MISSIYCQRSDLRQPQRIISHRAGAEKKGKSGVNKILGFWMVAIGWTTFVECYDNFAVNTLS